MAYLRPKRASDFGAGTRPMLAAALSLSCEIWTEDTDFFGTGVAVWTSDRVEIFLKERSEFVGKDEV